MPSSNRYRLISEDLITKMFRGTSVDVEDCISVFKTGNVDPELLLERYANAALYDLNPLKMITNYYYFSEKLSHAELVDEKYLTKVKQKIEDIKASP